jgi:hypothetical protein
MNSRRASLRCWAYAEAEAGSRWPRWAAALRDNGTQAAQERERDHAKQHARPGRVGYATGEADLLRAPLHKQLRLHHGRQLDVIERAALWSATLQFGPLLCLLRRALSRPTRRGPASLCGATHG